MNKVFKVLSMPLLASVLLLSPVNPVHADQTVPVNMGVTGGSLVLAVPSGAAPIVLPAVSINQVITANQTTSNTFPSFNVTDARGSGAGWRIQLTSLAFQDGTKALPSNRTYVIGSAFASQPGISNNIPTKTALVDGSSYTLLSAATDAGMGAYSYAGFTLGYDFLVNDSKSIKAGSYVSQATLALVTGP